MRELELLLNEYFVKFRSNTWKVWVQFNYFTYSMLARIKRGLPPKYAGTALSIILWSWMNLKLDSGSFWESWEHHPGLGSGTFKKMNLYCICTEGQFSSYFTFISLTGSQFELAVSCSLNGPSKVSRTSLIWKAQIAFPPMAFSGVVKTP